MGLCHSCQAIKRVIIVLNFDPIGLSEVESIQKEADLNALEQQALTLFRVNSPERQLAVIEILRLVWQHQAFSLLCSPPERQLAALEILRHV